MFIHDSNEYKHVGGTRWRTLFYFDLRSNESKKLLCFYFYLVPIQLLENLQINNSILLFSIVDLICILNQYATILYYIVIVALEYLTV